MARSRKKTQESLVDANNRVDNWAYLWLAIFMVGAYALLRGVEFIFGLIVAKWLAVGVIVFAVAAFIHALYEGRANEKLTVYIISFLAIVLRAYYLIVTAKPEYTGMNADIINQMSLELSLPNIVQPLYFVIASAIKYLAEMISFTSSEPFEIVRLVNEYFSILGIVVMYYIMCELETNNTGTYLCTLIMAFHPSFIIVGGQIDQTTLFVLLTMFTVLYLIRWTTFSESINFIFAGMCLGLALMTDLRAVVFIPVMVVLMIVNLMRIIKRRQFINVTENVLKSLLGAFICAVLSLAYPVFCTLNSKSVKLIYSAENSISESTSTFIEKFGGFSLEELLDIFPNSASDKNAWAYLIKSSVFTEGNHSIPSEIVMTVYVMAAGILLILCAFLGIMAVFSRMDDKKKENIVMIFLFTLLSFVSYILINAKYSSSVMMNFANMEHILPLLVAMLGGGMRVLANKKKYHFGSNIIYMLTVALGYIFCISSAVYYMIYFTA